MRATVTTLCLAVTAATAPLAAQVPERIESGDSEIVLTVWAGGNEPAATVLLVPGWGSGPTDALGIGRALSASGVAVVVLTPRGWHESEGEATFAHALGDIEAALTWIRESGRTGLSSSSVILGGHSWGGGVALAYAAMDPMVRRVFSIAGTDHGLFIRQIQSDPEYAVALRQILTASAAPRGPIRFDVDGTLQELADGQATYGLIENVEHLADRSVLLIGGWDDTSVTVDQTMLPLYRALEQAGNRDVRLEVYRAGHNFRAARPELHADLLEWIMR